MTSQVAIVLAEPENVDNIGAVARAMKNMGISDLRLVKPPTRWKKKGKKMAVSAVDLLEKAKTFKTLTSALSDCQLVIGTSRRKGGRRRNFLPYFETIQSVQAKKKTWRTAFVFGKESKGLSNEELLCCDGLITIPSSPAYPSLNLAQAVMVVCFSLASGSRLSSMKDSEILENEAESMIKSLKTDAFLRVSKSEVDEILEQLEVALIGLDYRYEGKGVIERILVTFSGLIKRAGLQRSEARMLKGFLRRILERNKLLEATSNRSSA